MTSSSQLYFDRRCCKVLKIGNGKNCFESNHVYCSLNEDKIMAEGPSKQAFLDLQIFGPIFTKNHGGGPSQVRSGPLR